MQNYPNQAPSAQAGQGSQATNPEFVPQQAQLAPPVPEAPESQESIQERTLYVESQKKNLAEDLPEQELATIGKDCKEGYDADENSRKAWLNETEEWMNMAKQVRETKTFPWPDASNIKYPLISIASLQFNARSYPTLIPGDGQLVKSRVIGKDPTGQKSKKGQRIASYMSWQFMKQMDYWEEDMDKLLIMLPIIGMVFKETYYNPVSDKVESCLILPKDFVIDYWAESIETAMRYSKNCPLSKQDIKELQLRGHYLDIDIGEPPTGDSTAVGQERKDFITPYKIVKQYTWLDLDEDGLREPYCVTFDYTSCKVLNITARYNETDVVVNEKGKPVAYNAQCNFTKFPFIPNPDGSFYDMGFGHLLGPINEAVNSLINQLVDAGTLSNLQGGFIGKGLKLRMGETPLKPGEWRSVNAIGDDIRKQMVQFPSKEPSNVLFQLLGSLITSGKELASVAEIFVGKMPGQNTPATTTMATIEQGMKVFTAIYKRVFRALDKEFKKVFKLNNYYLDEKSYGEVLDEPVNPQDFDYKTYDVCPAADPTATTQGEKLQKAQALMDLMGTGLLDPMKVIQRVLEAQDQPNWQELIPGMAETGQATPPQPQPDPKLLAIQEKAKVDQMKAQQTSQIAAQKSELEKQSKEFEMQAKAAMNQLEQQHKERMMILEAESKQRMNDIFAAQAKAKAVETIAQGNLKLEQSDAQHKQKLAQEKSKSSPKKSSKSGKGTQ